MLSVPSKHALKALLTLSEYERGEHIPVTMLAEEAELPAPYLSKLLKQLAREKLVITKKGPKGGVALPNAKISVIAVCEVFADPILKDTCMLSKSICSTTAPCPFHKLWSHERKKVQSFLKKLRI